MSKNNENAATCRSEGNKFYNQKNFYDAIVKYNESLCHSIVGSEAMGLAYANRSAVYFELKMFEKCLKNIEMAKSCGYPKNKLKILESRAVKCEEGLKNQNDPKEEVEDFLKLSYEPNDQLPFVVKCLELRRNKKFGRFLVTTQDLKVGDILAIEEPHFKILKSDSRYESCEEMNKYQRCAVCLRDNLMDLIPCPKCTSTMYCSLDCMKVAEENFHNFECDIIEILNKSGIMQMAMRIFFQALNIFDGSIEEMQKFIEQFKNASFSIFDFSNLNEKEKSKIFLGLMFCSPHRDNVSLENSPFLRIFKTHPYLSELWNHHENFIKDFMTRFVDIYGRYFHGISGWSRKESDKEFSQMIGTGFYAFASLINHSCYPNVNRIYINDKLVIVVARPVKSGDQIFDCYRSQFYQQPKEERLQILTDEYAFRCRCEACLNDFPLYNTLSLSNRELYKFAKNEKEEIQKLNHKKAKIKFPEMSSKIQNEFTPNECPSCEIILLQECFQQCLAILTKPNILLP